MMIVLKTKGVCFVMVTVVRNGYDDPPGQGCLCSADTSGKGLNQTVLPSALNK